MNKTVITSGVVGLIIGAVLALAITMQLGYGPPGKRQMMDGRGGDVRGAASMRNVTRHFIEEMIPHHQDAVLMADLGLKKAEHKELKQLATDIKTAQAKEIREMRSWYKSWYGAEVPESSGSMGDGMMDDEMMGGGMMGKATDLASLKNAKPFDKEFIEQMIPHHQMAVMMAQMAFIASDRDEIRTLAKNIIAAQNREIVRMQGWYTQWYAR